MASFILSSSLLVLLLSFVSLFSRLSISEAKTSFSFSSFGKDANFESDNIALFDDAKLLDGGSSVQLTDSMSHGGGRVVYKKPIECVTKSAYTTGFSTVFSFSISPEHGGRLEFVAFPVNGTFDHSLFQVKFDISDNLTKFENPSFVVIVNGATVSKKISNFTITNLDKEKVLLYAWVNYIASGKFLEIRLSKSISFGSVDPLMFDLPDMLKDEGEFMVGVKSYNGNINLQSWSLETRHVSKDVHSYAALLEAKRGEEEAKRRQEDEAKKRRSERMWEILTCFVMTFGSTALVFFAMMHIWTAFKRNNLVKVMQEECGIKTKEFEYEKMEMEKMEVAMSKADAKQERK